MVNYTFIVTTVLILLSAALITFIQYYYTQQTENAIREDASRIGHLVEQGDNKTLAIEPRPTINRWIRWRYYNG